MTELKEGWAACYGSRKWHYFVLYRSLCRNFGLVSNVELEQGNDRSPDNCAACMKKLAKRNEKRVI